MACKMYKDKMKHASKQIWNQNGSENQFLARKISQKHLW